MFHSNTATKAALSADYTLVQVMLLAGPTLLCLRVGLDANAIAAVGYFPLVALAVFPALAIAGALERKGFGKLPLFLIFLACAVLLSVVGLWVDYWARAWSPDCNLELEGEGTPGMPAYDENREAAFDQPSRLEAGKFYASCLHDLQANVSGWPVEAQRARFEEMTVWHCPGYLAFASTEPAFRRLETREATFGCAGLCFPRAPIWTPYYEQAPACGPILSNFMLKTVSRTGIQAATWSAMLVVAACSWAVVLSHHQYAAQPQVVRV
jgi:hypothetical protein